MRVDTSKGAETVNYETCATWVKFFYDRLSDNAESEDKQRSGVFSKAFAVKATSLVMINMIRLMTKEEYDVGLHIQTQTRERFVNLLGAPSSALPKCSTFAPPHAEFLQRFKESIPKATPLARQLAILMIEGYSIETSEHVRGYWKAGCALSLSYTGLGAIGWFEKARDRLKLSGYDLCKQLAIPAMLDFIEEYLQLRRFQDSRWIFCRLLE